MGTRRTTSRRTPAAAAAVAALHLVLAGCLVLAGGSALTGCAVLADAAAPRGLRRGVDVPSRPGDPGAQPLRQAPAGPVGDGGYAFLTRHPDGTAVAWDPCRPVHYVVRGAGGPPDGDRWLAWAFGQLGVATGLTFLDDGATDEEPTQDRGAYLRPRYGDRWAPVLVTWATPAETPPLTDAVLGRAGPRSFSAHGDRQLRWVSGTATFNGPALRTMLGAGEEAKVQAVLLHELGHLVGLGHVSDPYQVMFDTNAYPVSAYRPGDLRGLALLGAGRCFTDY